MATVLTGMNSQYALRSLRHESRMLALYRRKAPAQPTLRYAWVKACCRAAAFEWVLAQEEEKVLRLWREAIHVLADPVHEANLTSDQCLLGLHLSLVTRDLEAFRTLAYSTTKTSAVETKRKSDNTTFSATRNHLLEGYGLLAMALLEQRLEPARAGLQALHAALATNERAVWQKQAPSLLAANWLMAEHRAVCMLLKAVAEILVQSEAPVLSPALLLPPARQMFFGEPTTPPFATRFALAMDEALARLEKYVAIDAAHHPHLYLWIPGLALCQLAQSARLPLDWLRQRYNEQPTGYARLPQAFLAH